MKKKAYEIVVDRLIEKMEAGIIPWVKPWQGGGTCRNFENGKFYSGINMLMTSGSPSPYFMTLKQIRERGGRVKDEEFLKSYLIVFWNWVKKKDEDGDESEDGKGKSIPCMRFYSVWDLTQIEELPEDYVEKRKLKYEGERIEFVPLEEADNIILNMPSCPDIKSGGDKAYYQPAGDYVQMPPEICFKSQEGYYETLFHELVHSTGHESRLSRPSLMKLAAFGSEAYSEEELTAEIGTAMLCNRCGMDMIIENAAAYCQSWLKAIRSSDKKQMLINCSQRAQKAVDWMIPKQDEKTEEVA